MIVLLPQVVMLPTVHLKGEIELDWMPVTLVNLSNDVIHVAKCDLVGYLKLRADYHKIQYLKIHQLVVEQQEDVLPCTQPSASFLYSPSQVNTHREINSEYSPPYSEVQQVLDKLIEEYKDIFSLHQQDKGHIKLLIMDIDTGDHPPIEQKPLLLKHTKWIQG